MPHTAPTKDEQGQAIVELAIVLPVLMMLVLGIFQFGIVFSNYVTLTDAVRAGARTAAVSRKAVDPTATAIARVRASASDLKQADLAVSVDVPGGWLPGSTVTVTASYPYDVNVLGLVVKSGRLSSTTQERVE